MYKKKNRWPGGMASHGSAPRAASRRASKPLPTSGDRDKSPEERPESGIRRSIEKNPNFVTRVSPRPRPAPNGSFAGAHQSISPPTSPSSSFKCELEDCQCGGRIFSSRNGAQQLIEHMYAQVEWLRVGCKLGPFEIDHLFRIANRGKTVQCSDCHKWFGSQHFYVQHTLLAKQDNGANECIPRPHPVSLDDGSVGVIDGDNEPNYLLEWPINAGPAEDAPADSDLVSIDPAEEENPLSDASVLAPQEEENEDDGARDGDAVDGDAPAFAKILDPNSVASCALIFVSLMQNGKNMLRFMPENDDTIFSVRNVCRKYLKEIMEASNANQFYQAWLNFFKIPGEIFVMEARGPKKGKKGTHLSDQIAKSIDALLSREAAPVDENEIEGSDDEQNPPIHVQGKLEDNIGRRLAAARRFASQGWLSKAFAMLTRTPLPLANEQTLTEILKMFPIGDLDALPELPDNANDLVISVGPLKQAIKQFGKMGKAAGPSYWYPNLFSIFLDDPELMSLYSMALAKLINSKDLMTRDLSALLLGGRVINPVKKKAVDGKPETHRAIVFSEAVLNHLMSVALKQIAPDDILKKFKDHRNLLIQFGVSVPAGVEKAFRIIETGLLMASDYNLDIQSLDQDIVNAYQTLNRNDILEAFYADTMWKPLWRVIDLLMSNAAPRYIETEDRNILVFMQTLGGAQGWSAMSLIYGVTSIYVLKKVVTAARPSLIMATVVDDCNSLGNNQDLLDAFDISKEEFSRIGSEISLNKSVLVTHANLDEEQKAEWTTRGIEVVDNARLLGGCLSVKDECVTAFLEKNYGINSEKMLRIQETLNYPKIDLKLLHLFLTKGLQHHTDYLARITSPQLAEPIFKDIDCWIKKVFLQKFGLKEFFEGNHLPEWQPVLDKKLEQMCLPEKMAGFGFRPIEYISKCAWLASLAACASEVLGVIEALSPEGIEVEGPERMRRDYEFSRTFLLEKCGQELGDAIFDKNDEIKEQNMKILPTKLIDYLRNFRQCPNLALNFQSILTKLMFTKQYDTLMQSLSVADKKRVTSYSQEDASRILLSHPSAKRFGFIHSSHWEQIVRLRLGLMPAPWMYLRAGPIVCRLCNRVDLKIDPSHFLHCPCTRRKEVLWGHDGVCSRLYDAAKKNGLPVMWTPQLEGGEATDVGFVIDGGKFLHVDVSIVSAVAPSKVANGDLKPLSAAKQAALLKFDKYDDIVGCLRDEIFTPMVFEASGAFPKETGIIIKVLAEAGKANMIPFPVTRSAIRDSIAACIQVRNALANKAGLNYLRTLAPSWTQAKQARAARKEAKVPRRQVHLSGARMAFG